MTSNESMAVCSDAVIVDTGATNELLFSGRKKINNVTKNVTSSDNNNGSCETMEDNCEVGQSEEDRNDTVVNIITKKKEMTPSDGDRASSDDVESCAGKEITFDGSKEGRSNAAMVENKRMADITASEYNKYHSNDVMMTNEKNKKTTFENNETCDDSDVKDKYIEQAQTITDISSTTQGNQNSEVYGDGNINDLPAGEPSFKSPDLRIARKVFGDKVLRSHTKDIQERAGICFQEAAPTNLSNEKITSASNTNDSVWDYKVIHVDSSDLQVVGDGTGEFSAGNSEQAARRVQNGSKKVKATKNISPTGIKESRQKPDTSVGHLKFRKILPKPQINLVFNHVVVAQGKQDVMDSILHPVTREQNPCCDNTNRHKENVDTTQLSRPYKCTHCKKVFKEACDLKKHVRIHTNVSPYKCAHCNKTFTAQYDVTEHERTHTGVRPFKCTYCNKAFVEKRRAKEHERSHTAEKSHKCTYCDKAFPRQSHLKRHEFIHTGDSPHKCTYCGKVFRNKWDVQVHERIHTGVKPFTCKLCNKAFTQRSGLNVHGRIHTGIAPYQCRQCNKAFTRKSHLMEHERIHTGTRPYKCTYCSKAFTQKGTLKKHERTHTGVKPYKCENCDKSFSRRSDLVKHENVHTGEKL